MDRVGWEMLQETLGKPWFLPQTGTVPVHPVKRSKNQICLPSDEYFACKPETFRGFHVACTCFGQQLVQIVSWERLLTKTFMKPWNLIQWCFSLRSKCLPPNSGGCAMDLEVSADQLSQQEGTHVNPSGQVKKPSLSAPVLGRYTANDENGHWFLFEKCQHEVAQCYEQHEVYILRCI